MNPLLTVVSGIVQGKEFIRAIAYIDQLKERRSTASRIYKIVSDDWSSGEWSSSVFDLEWSAIEFCLLPRPTLKMVIMSENGTIMIAGSQGPQTYQVAPGTSGPEGYGPLRSMCAVGEAIYLVGMGRQVYRVTTDGEWSVHEEGLTRPSEEHEVCGFNAIHGLVEERLYAVGFRGEIWMYENHGWRGVDSPTDLVLHCVRLQSDKEVYVGGGHGALLHGRGDRFELLESGTEDDIWSMEIFRDKLYFCTEKSVYVKDGEAITKLELGVDNEVLRSVHSSDDMICVFGPKVIMQSYDGESWRRIALGAR